MGLGSSAPRRPPDLWASQHYIHLALKTHFDTIIEAESKLNDPAKTWTTADLCGSLLPLQCLDYWMACLIYAEFMNQIRILLDEHHFHEEEYWFPCLKKNIPDADGLFSGLDRFKCTPLHLSSRQLFVFFSPLIHLRVAEADLIPSGKSIVTCINI
jgi:hypothetical protein